MAGLRVDRKDSVVTLTLDRPDRRNAIDVPTWEALHQALTEVAAREDDRVLVLTGAGGCFSSGGDLAGRGEPGEAPIDVMRRTVNATCLALHQLPKPSLAVVPGLAAGAGANLAFGCDLVLAAASARFAELFVDRGLPLDSGGSWLLPRLIGPQRAKQLAFFGDWVSAEDAHRLGLVSRVLPDEELGAEARRWAARLAAKSPGALGLIKRALQGGLERSLEQALEDEAQAVIARATSPEFLEQMRRFRRDDDDADG